MRINSKDSLPTSAPATGLDTSTGDSPSTQDEEYNDDDDDDDDDNSQESSTNRQHSSAGGASKLKFHNVTLSGRSQELTLLCDCYKRISSSNHAGSETVLITGESGTGKTKLAEALREIVEGGTKGFFVSGKFNHARNEPYGALVDAFTQLCNLVVVAAAAAQDQQNNNNEEREGMTVALKDELFVLKKMIPNISTMTTTTILTATTTTSPEDMMHINGRGCFTRLKLACRKFLKVIASEHHPVVLHLDDLQWADEESIQIIQSIATDVGSKYILIIATQTTTTQTLAHNILQPLENGALYLPCTTISLENLELDQVTHLVSNLLERTNTSNTADLVTFVWNRTDGLPFFVVKLMELLKVRGLLVFDEKIRDWKWNISELQTKMTDKLVDTIVAAQIDEAIKKKSHHILRLASAQGFRFDQEVLTALVTKDINTNNNAVKKKKKKKTKKSGSAKERVKKALKVAVRKGFVEKNSDGSFQFTHDHIHQYLYSTIPITELPDLHLSIARVLQELILEDDNGKYVFALANHLNEASAVLLTNKDKLDCGQSNLRAADLAIEKAAYNLAAQYACQGLAHLETTNKWSEYYYTLSLDLHCKAADSYHSCGNVEQCHQHLEEVLHNAQSISDCCPAYAIKVRSLGAQANLDEAIDVAFAVVRELGVKIPKKINMPNAIWQMVKTKAILRGKTDEQLLDFNESSESADMIHAISFLGMATNYASWAMKIPHLCISIVTMLQMSMRGQASDSTVFASYGILAAVMKDIPEAVRMGRLALQYQGSQAGMHITLSISHTFLLHWRVPFHESLEALVRAYHSGMDAGDFDAAFMSTQSYILMAFYCGHRLVELEEQMRAYCTQMFEFDNMSHIYQSLPYWQLFLNMLGRNENPTILTGEAMDQAILEQEGRAVKLEIVSQTTNMLRIFLCYQFEETQSLISLLAEFEGYDIAHIGHFMHYVSQFYTGLSYIALYRRLGKRSYIQKALKIIKQMRKWTEDGCVNTKPMLSLLQAEMATLLNPQAVQDVTAAFMQAIDDANEYQNAGLAALANERAAHYFEFIPSNQREAREYMRRAVELYEYWDAMAKVTFLKEQYQHQLLDPPPVAM